MKEDKNIGPAASTPTGRCGDLSPQSSATELGFDETPSEQRSVFAYLALPLASIFTTSALKVLAIGLPALTLLLLLLPYFRSFKLRHSDFINFVIAMVATFCGVSWALQLADDQLDRRDRKVVRSLLKSSDLDIIQLANTVKMRMREHETQRFDASSINPATYRLTPIPKPALLESILESEIALRNISPMSTLAYRRYVQKIDWFIDSANSGQIDSSQTMGALDFAGRYLSATHHGLEAEIGYLEGRFDDATRDTMTNRWFRIEIRGDSTTGSWRDFRRFGHIVRVRQRP